MNENKIKKDRQTTWLIRQVSSRAMAALNRLLWLSRFLRAANNLESEYAYIDIFFAFSLVSGAQGLGKLSEKPVRNRTVT